MVVLLIFEHHMPNIFSDGSAGAGNGSPPSFRRALHEIVLYLVIVLRIFFMTRRGFLGLVLAVIPFGGMALSLTVSTVITPTLGMNDNEIATLGLVASLVFVVCCMLGGFLSDRFGRKLTLAVFSAGTLLPTLWMGWRLHSDGWTMPVEASADGTWPRHEALIHAWWMASLVYSVFQGLMYGIRTAFFMDIVEPRIAATHFTACMAMLNLVTVYSYWWEGKAITSLADGGWGFTYLQIFLIGCGLGCGVPAGLAFHENPSPCRKNQLGVKIKLVLAKARAVVAGDLSPTCRKPRSTPPPLSRAISGFPAGRSRAC